MSEWSIGYPSECYYCGAGNGACDDAEYQESQFKNVRVLIVNRQPYMQYCCVHCGKAGEGNRVRIGPSVKECVALLQEAIVAIVEFGLPYALAQDRVDAIQDLFPARDLMIKAMKAHDEYMRTLATILA